MVKLNAKILLVLTGLMYSFIWFQNAKWIAPEKADRKINPFRENPAATASGESIYQRQCWSCHGDKGKGDGPASVNLVPKPSDLSKMEIQEQSDGAFFWKISEGRGSMPAFKYSLSEKQRWGLVNYLRTLH